MASFRFYRQDKALRERISAQRFAQKANRPGLKRATLQMAFYPSCHHDDSGRATSGIEHTLECKSVNSRHANVGDDARSAIDFTGTQNRLSGFVSGTPITQGNYQLNQRLAHREVVINDANKRSTGQVGSSLVVVARRIQLAAVKLYVIKLTSEHRPPTDLTKNLVVRRV
jgi:hypothetical protein